MKKKTNLLVSAILALTVVACGAPPERSSDLFMDSRDHRAEEPSTDDGDDAATTDCETIWLDGNGNCVDELAVTEAKRRSVTICGPDHDDVWMLCK